MPKPTSYPLLSRVKDPDLRQLLKLMFDKVGAVEQQTAGIGAVTQPLADPLDANGNQLTGVADPTAGSHAVNLDYLKRYVQGAIALDKRTAAIVTPPVPGTGPVPPVPVDPGAGLVCQVDFAAGQPGGAPAAPNKRWFRGDFCGVEVPGLPAVAGGASNPNVVLTPFFDRYGATEQLAILAAYAARAYTHFLLWWPDSRNAGGVGGGGQSIAQFVATCQQVRAAGFYTVVNLYSKVYDGANPSPALNDAVIAALTAVGAMDICILAFEAEEFFDPAALQAMIDHVTGILVPLGVPCYIHFSVGVHSDPPADTLPSVFWATNVGKLTGLCWQLDTTRTCGAWQDGFNQLMTRLGRGDAGWPKDSGFGHPFDIVALEYSATARFAGGMTEGQAQAIGNQWICAPAVAIPTGPYAGQVMRVQGFCNGGPTV